MTNVAGVDGFSGGWICLSRNTDSGAHDAHNAIEVRTFSSAQELIDEPSLDLLAIDIPIGLTDDGPRLCDQQARKILAGPRSSSVFPAPLRAALAAKDWPEACALTEAAIGKKVTIQAWSIFPKVRDIDVILSSEPRLQERVREVHPELCFLAWNRQCPLRHGKKQPKGLAERMALIDRYFGPDTVAHIRSSADVGNAKPDDICDALAALWTAERIARGDAQRIPAEPEVDGCGLRMEIWS